MVMGRTGASGSASSSWTCSVCPTCRGGVDSVRMAVTAKTPSASTASRVTLSAQSRDEARLLARIEAGSTRKRFIAPYVTRAATRTSFARSARPYPLIHSAERSGSWTQAFQAPVATTAARHQAARRENRRQTPRRVPRGHRRASPERSGASARRPPVHAPPAMTWIQSANAVGARSPQSPA